MSFSPSATLDDFHCILAVLCEYGCYDQAFRSEVSVLKSWIDHDFKLATAEEGIELSNALASVIGFLGSYPDWDNPRFQSAHSSLENLHSELEEYLSH